MRIPISIVGHLGVIILPGPFGCHLDGVLQFRIPPLDPALPLRVVPRLIRCAGIIYMLPGIVHPGQAAADDLPVQIALAILTLELGVGVEIAEIQVPKGTLVNGVGGGQVYLQVAALPKIVVFQPIALGTTVPVCVPLAGCPVSPQGELQTVGRLPGQLGRAALPLEIVPWFGNDPRITVIPVVHGTGDKELQILHRGNGTAEAELQLVGTIIVTGAI